MRFYLKVWYSPFRPTVTPLLSLTGQLTVSGNFCRLPRSKSSSSHHTHIRRFPHTDSSVILASSCTSTETAQPDTNSNMRITPFTHVLAFVCFAIQILAINPGQLGLRVNAPLAGSGKYVYKYIELITTLLSIRYLIKYYL